jgi:hypothetical protein
MALTALWAVACSRGEDASGTSEPRVTFDKHTGLPYVTDPSGGDAAQDTAEAKAARSLTGDRGALTRSFQDGVPLLPLTDKRMSLRGPSGFDLASTDPLSVTSCLDASGNVVFVSDASDCLTPITTGPVIDANGDVIGEDQAGACEAAAAKQVCVKACATATASAFASAFAHASVKTCAWAKAFACVWSREPFAKVCAWAKSESCASAFATAFAYGFAVDTETVCKEQCG